MTPILDRYFGLAERGTDVRTEVMAGRRHECSPTLIVVALLFAGKFAWL